MRILPYDDPAGLKRKEGPEFWKYFSPSSPGSQRIYHPGGIHPEVLWN